jgi:hypothetical protein
MSEGNLTVRTVKQQLEPQLVDEVAAQTQHDGVVAAWISPLHAHSELVRVLEADVFPEVPDIMRPYELACDFLALVDTRPNAARVVHAFRLSSSSGLSSVLARDHVGTVLIDDLVASNQGLDHGVIADYYAERGIDLHKSLSIETNFRVGERTETETGLPPAQVGYLAIYQRIVREDIQVLFAHLNEPAIRSLDGVGVGWEPIAGRSDVRTPTVGGTFDEEYRPVAILVNPENSAVLESLADFMPPEVPFA